MGSSPLARGLLGAAAGADRVGRIIPARAGFTLPRPPCGGVVADHPRSRGVYPGRWMWGMRRSGSSPLARGLHRGPDRRHRDGGIIPARAGFTDGPLLSRSSAPDHPRSRGVYVAAGSMTASALGSSPLARGLPPQARQE